MRSSAIVALLVITLAGTLSAAGFDCAKATTPTEKAICADPALSDLDSKLTTVYAALRKALPADQVTVLKASQVRWLKESRTGTDRASLTDAYRKRIARLEAVQKAAASFSPYGEFEVDHPIEFYNQETDSRDILTATDSYVLRKISDKAIEFSINITGHNAHQCDVSDTARLVSAGIYQWREKASAGSTDGTPCTIRITVSADRVRVEPSGEGCSSYCGARAWLSDVYLRAVERVK